MSELYELPNGWEWKKLDKTVKFAQGIQIPIENQFENYEDGLNTFIRIINYTQKSKEFRFIKQTSEKSTVSDNDIVMVRYGATAGFVGKGISGIIANNMFRVIPLSEEILDKEFLFLFLKSNTVQNILNQNIGAAAMPAINFKTMSLIDIPLPPLSEQQRIVSKLDLLFQKIDKSIELHQKNMDEANAFMGSVLNEVFVELEEKYSKKHLKDIVSKLGDGLHGTPKYDEAGEYYFINGANVSDNKIIVNQNTKKVNEEEYHKYKKELNDKTIFVSINGTLGNIGLYDNEKCILGKSACYFNLLDNIDKIYITYVLKNQDFQQYIRENATGATIKNVSLKTMREYSVVLPPLPIQQKVVVYLDSVSEKMEKAKSIQKEKMESLKALKASILDKAFRGEL